MFLLVPAHPGCPGQSPQSRKTVVCVCAVAVKLQLFKSFCSCFYDVALWKIFTAGCLDKFRSAYVKCIKVFFGYAKVYSVTDMLTELNQQNFDSLMDNVEVTFNGRFMHVTMALYNILCFCIYCNCVFRHLM